VNVFKDEIKKIKGDLDASERERFVLSEKISNLEVRTPADESDASELKKLKKELAEAKTSLEEVYKALS
jgi:hypothetical protein